MVGLLHAYRRQQPAGGWALRVSPSSFLLLFILSFTFGGVSSLAEASSLSASLTAGSHLLHTVAGVKAVKVQLMRSDWSGDSVGAYTLDIVGR